ncbi:hypothetical protein F3J34_31955 [Klebsiella sp. Ap-873]|nr:hypothetical protein [Klebsiella sp. Ap-873]
MDKNIHVNYQSHNLNKCHQYPNAIMLYPALTPDKKNLKQSKNICNQLNLMAFKNKKIKQKKHQEKIKKAHHHK